MLENCFMKRPRRKMKLVCVKEQDGQNVKLHKKDYVDWMVQRK